MSSSLLTHKKKPKKRVKIKRKFSGQYIAYLIHSFFGLKISLILTLVLASGTLAVIASEIDWLFYPEIRVMPAGDRLNEGLLFDSLQAAYPDNGLTSLQLNSQYPYTAASAMFNDSSGGFRNAWIDPYTGKVQGDTPILTVGNFLSFLHGTLFLPVVGRSIVNAFGVFTLISLVAGLMAYPKFWRYFLKKPRTGNLRVFLADVHKLIGLWSLWFLLIIGVSGSWWFYKVPLVLYADAPKLHKAYPRKPLLDYAELDKLGNTAPKALSSEEIVNVFKQQYPQMIISMLTPSEHNADPYTVVAYDGEFLLSPFSANKFYLNPFDGRIIEQHLSKDMTAMQRVDRAMGPLHYGTWALGGVSDLVVKMLWFIFGALMTALAVTGLIINYKRTRRISKIIIARSTVRRRLLKVWQVIRPWGGPMGVFKYFNVVMLFGVFVGTGVVLTIASQGVGNSGFEYTTQKIGPWNVRMNAYAGLLEKDLPPIRAGGKTNFLVDMPNEAFNDIKFIYAKVGKPRNLRAPGTLIHGPMGTKHVHYQLPRKIRDKAELWVTAITWSGEVHQVSWPLMPDGEKTIDLR